MSIARQIKVVVLCCAAALPMCRCHADVRGRPQPGGQPVVREREPQAAPLTSPDAVAPGVAAPVAAGGKSAGPRRLPTFVDMDWKAFPRPSDPGFGRSGRTVKVRPGGGRIGRALERARPGDTLVLEGGTYTEGAEDEQRALVIDKDGIVIRSRPGARARIVPRDGQVTYGVVIQASHVMLSGLDLEGFTAVGVALDKDGATIKSTILSDLNVRMGRSSNWIDGIVAYTDNRRLGRPASDGLLVQNVTVTGASLGISCNAGPCRSWWLENIRIDKMAAAEGDPDAFAIASGDNIVIIGADISGARADGIAVKATRVLVMNSHVHDLARNGIKLYHGGDIINCIVHHTGADAAVLFDHAGRYRILNSVIAYHNYPQPKTYNLTAGYDYKERLQVELVNSIFYMTSGGSFFSDLTTLKVQNCIFHGIRTPQMWMRVRARGKEVEIQRRQGGKIFDKLGLGSGNRFVDPGFVAPKRGDFRLKPSSPAIDGGRRVKGMPGFDHAGKPRIRGRAPDIGALECG